MGNVIYVVGIGPGNHEDMTIRADECLRNVQVIAGYDLYVDLIKDRYPGKEYITTGMRQEIDRCRMALEEAAKGRSVALVCSGDSQVYGMASLIFELLSEGADKETSPAGEVLKSLKAGTGSPDVKSGADVEVEVIPGITAALGGSAILGAVVNHDFCTISLSDYLTPRELIRKRLECAAISDMVIVLYNPGSRLRTDALKEACEILMEKTGGDRLCGVVRNIGREGEEYRIMTLSELKEYRADMYTTVFIGNSQSRVVNGRLITPRGYEF
ncbi:MAG: precorrin-3B C(17)-methyltransferase [Lachnospiraceae bacterium]|nr:precorrin-3B C(17)-methyltransferase [Lachnospiraceae bacterium]